MMFKIKIINSKEGFLVHRIEFFKEKVVEQTILFSSTSKTLALRYVNKLLNKLHPSLWSINFKEGSYCISPTTKFDIRNLIKVN